MPCGWKLPRGQTRYRWLYENTLTGGKRDVPRRKGTVTAFKKLPEKHSKETAVRKRKNLNTAAMRGDIDKGVLQVAFATATPARQHWMKEAWVSIAVKSPDKQ